MFTFCLQSYIKELYTPLGSSRSESGTCFVPRSSAKKVSNFLFLSHRIFKIKVLILITLHTLLKTSCVVFEDLLFIRNFVQDCHEIVLGKGIRKQN